MTMILNNYKVEDFRFCQFNPMADRPMLAVYPQLSDAMQSEWLYDKKIDLLIRYVILVYDPKSALLDERDVNRRKQSALDILEISDTETQDKWIRHDHEFLAELITAFLNRFLKSREYAMLQAIEFKFWESIRLTMQSISGKNSKEELEALQKKSIAADEMDKDIKRLEAMQKQYFMDDEGLVRKVKKRITPEGIAGSGHV